MKKNKLDTGRHIEYGYIKQGGTTTVDQRARKMGKECPDYISYAGQATVKTKYCSPTQPSPKLCKNMKKYGSCEQYHSFEEAEPKCECHCHTPQLNGETTLCWHEVMTCSHCEEAKRYPKNDYDQAYIEAKNQEEAKTGKFCEYDKDHCQSIEEAKTSSDRDGDILYQILYEKSIVCMGVRCINEDQWPIKELKEEISKVREEEQNKLYTVNSDDFYIKKKTGVSKIKSEPSKDITECFDDARKQPIEFNDTLTEFKQQLIKKVKKLKIEDIWANLDIDDNWGFKVGMIREGSNQAIDEVLDIIEKS